MMLNYGMFFSLMGSLLICLWLTRENVKLKKRNLELCNMLVHVNMGISEAVEMAKEINGNIENKLDDLEEGYMEDLEDDYSKMAEHLACIREEEADREKEEQLLASLNR